MSNSSFLEEELKLRKEKVYNIANMKEMYKNFFSFFNENKTYLKANELERVISYLKYIENLMYNETSEDDFCRFAFAASHLKLKN